ncbi:MAG: MBOAT family protein [Oscillospiraceae bacterium]|nr:MBOAT family protein [Oscillospiraceae bacterium]
MVFTSYEFLGFLAVLLLLYYLAPKKLRPPLLLVGSLVFYFFAGAKFLIYISVTAVTVWAAGLVIGKNLEAQSEYIKAHKAELSQEEKKAFREREKRKRKLWLALCLLLNLGILAAVKYTNFAIANINGLFGTKLGFITVAVPLGISYYTFMAIGYLVDVFRGTVKAEKSLWRFALFVSFFPHVIQGPISRYGDMSDSLFAGNGFDRDRFFRGLERVLWGFFKKLVIADRIFIAVGRIIGDSGKFQGPYILIGMLLYTVELYADFTGGIDITIGVAQMFGVEVKENFMRPYFSTSLKEYWRRWHITMCSWFRDYLFYPVSTSRWMGRFTKFTKKHFGQKAGKRIPVYVSSFIVWFSTGLWHGASWNFIVWGLLNWAILMVSEELEPLYGGFHKRLPGTNGSGYRVFMILRTFLLITVMNLFDCYATLGETIGSLASIFRASAWTGFSAAALGLSVSDWAVIAVGCAVMLAVSLLSVKKGVRERLAEKPYALRFAVFALLFAATVVVGVYGVGYDSSQFIYTRF